LISKIFDSSELLPLAWRDDAGTGAVHVCNPAIIRIAAWLLMAYIVRLSDGTEKIAICRLRNDWTVVPDSISPISDFLTNPDAAEIDARHRGPLADPRLFGLSDRLFMQFRTGPRPRPVEAHVVEVDTQTLHPIGVARTVVGGGPQDGSTNGWVFFQSGENLFAIQQLAPLRILRADISEPHRITLTDAVLHHWDSWSYEDAYGALRITAAPILHLGHWYVLARSSFSAEANGATPTDHNRCRVGALVLLAASPPFEPKLMSARPVIELNPAERGLPHQSDPDPGVTEAADPAGLVADDQGLILSYGVNHAFAALRRIDWADLAATLIPAVPRSPNLDPARTWRGSVAGPETACEPVQAAEPDALVVRAFWWHPGNVSPRSQERATNLAQHRFVHGNFGDLFAPHLVARLTGASPQHHADNPRLITVGSVIRTARDGDVLWGTGLNGAYPQMLHAPKQLHVYATRGPISYDFLRRGGFDISRVGAMFDPGSLVGHLFKNEVATLRQHIGNPPRDFILIPHFRDDTVMRQLYSQHQDRIRAVDAPFFETVSEILRSNLVISSSLHGLIVAEALGVPAVWHRSLMGVDDLKFIDYYLGTGRYRIVKADTLQSALKVTPMPLPTFDFDAILASFPSFADLQAHGIIRGRRPVDVGSKAQTRC
jgi:hypothetical protein